MCCITLKQECSRYRLQDLLFELWRLKAKTKKFERLILVALCDADYVPDSYLEFDLKLIVHKYA